MSDDEKGWSAFVVVNIEQRGDAVAKVLDELDQLGIAAQVVGQGRQLRRAPSLVLKVPQTRAAETIVALEARGFGDVLAYYVERDEA